MLCLTCPGSCAAAVAGFVGMGCRSHIANQEPPPAVSRLVAMEDLKMSELDPHDSQARALLGQSGTPRCLVGRHGLCAPVLRPRTPGCARMMAALRVRAGPPCAGARRSPWSVSDWNRRPRRDELGFGKLRRTTWTTCARSRSAPSGSPLGGTPRCPVVAGQVLSCA